MSSERQQVHGRQHPRPARGDAFVPAAERPTVRPAVRQPQAAARFRRPQRGWLIRQGWTGRRGRPGQSIDERGVVTTEAAIVIVVLLIFIVLAVAAGTYAAAKQNVVTAAEAAARAASIERSRGAARSAASAVAQATLDQESMRCAASVDTDLSGFSVPVGQPATVTSTVTCTVSLGGGVPIPGLARTVTLRATSASPLDTFRERR